MAWDYADINACEWGRLTGAAWSAWENAYAPYSGFRVGAALYLENDSIAHGCNVENASYSVTMCAERTALCSAVAQQGLRPRQILALAIVSDADMLTPPCGACRQALAEFADTLPILVVNRRQRKMCWLENLLPDAFAARNLGQINPERS
jgi:cytidine deaminase